MNNKSGWLVLALKGSRTKNHNNYHKAKHGDKQETETKKLFKEIRTQKILDYVDRESKRTAREKEQEDCFEPDEDQKEWVKTRMKGPSWTWLTWDGMIEEWQPWNIFGEPINVWRRYKLQ